MFAMRCLRILKSNLWLFLSGISLALPHFTFIEIMHPLFLFRFRVIRTTASTNAPSAAKSSILRQAAVYFHTILPGGSCIFSCYPTRRQLYIFMISYQEAAVYFHAILPGGSCIFSCYPTRRKLYIFMLS